MWFPWQPIILVKLIVRCCCSLFTSEVEAAGVEVKSVVQVEPSVQTRVLVGKSGVQPVLQSELSRLLLLLGALGRGRLAVDADLAAQWDEVAAGRADQLSDGAQRQAASYEVIHLKVVDDLHGSGALSLVDGGPGSDDAPDAVLAPPRPVGEDIPERLTQTSVLDSRKLGDHVLELSLKLRVDVGGDETEHAQCAALLVVERVPWVPLAGPPPLLVIKCSPDLVSVCVPPNAGQEGRRLLLLTSGCVGQHSNIPQLSVVGHERVRLESRSVHAQQTSSVLHHPIVLEASTVAQHSVSLETSSIRQHPISLKSASHTGHHPIILKSSLPLEHGVILKTSVTLETRHHGVVLEPSCPSSRHHTIVLESWNASSISQVELCTGEMCNNRQHS